MFPQFTGEQQQVWAEYQRRQLQAPGKSPPPLRLVNGTWLLPAWPPPAPDGTQPTYEWLTDAECRDLARQRLADQQRREAERQQQYRSKYRR